MTVNVSRTSRPTRTVARTLPYAGVAALTALALAACSSSGTSTSTAPAGGSTPGSTGTAGGSTGGQRQPGVNGLIAAVSGSTMQVQTRTDQTAVTWSNTTTFTKVAGAALADVVVGSCVTVLEPTATGTATTQSSTPATQVTAGTVEVRAATNGQCTGGFGGGGGGMGAPPSGSGGGSGAGSGGSGSGATPPAGAPTGSATGAPGGRGGNFARGAAGLVTAVNGSSFTIQETMGGRGTATATATPTSTTVTVTTTGSTTYTAQKAAAAGDVAVGECATAQGKADDTGAVAATSINLRPATNGSCTTGFGGAGGRAGSSGTATTGGTNG